MASRSGQETVIKMDKKVKGDLVDHVEISALTVMVYGLF